MCKQHFVVVRNKSSDKKDEKVVDAEFEEVDEDKKD